MIWLLTNSGKAADQSWMVETESLMNSFAVVKAQVIMLPELTTATSLTYCLITRPLVPWICLLY